MGITDGYELDWDSTIEKDEQQFTLVPEGDYNFTVDHIERTFVGSESQKYAGAKMATVYLVIQVPDQEPVEIRESFILHSNFAWKIGSLLVSVGLKKKGEPISGNYWSRLPGTHGRCKIIQNASKNNPERKFNNIATFYAPDERNDSGANKWAI